MAVTLLRNYANYASGTQVILDSDTESALVAQGLATAVTGGGVAVSRVGAPDLYITTGGVVSNAPQSGQGAPSALAYQGPLIWPCIGLGSLALASYETAGTAPVAGTMYLTEIWVPFNQTWTGIGKLNGTGVGTDNHLVALYGSNGALIANSAVAGVLAANASVFQNIPFTAPVPLPQGRYFLGVQSNGTTATLRHLVTANGVNVMTGAPTGVFGTIPATVTAPVTFTTAQGVITQLYV